MNMFGLKKVDTVFVRFRRAARMLKNIMPAFTALMLVLLTTLLAVCSSVSAQDNAVSGQGLAPAAKSAKATPQHSNLYCIAEVVQGLGGRGAP